MSAVPNESIREVELVFENEQKAHQQKLLDVHLELNAYHQFVALEQEYEVEHAAKQQASDIEFEHQLKLLREQIDACLKRGQEMQQKKETVQCQ
jgi:hypothetical protein